MISFLYGIYSFVITGVDDFLVLMTLYLLYKESFKYVTLGTFLGLISVMIPSYFSAKLLTGFSIADYIDIQIIMATTLIYLSYNLFKDVFIKDGDDDDLFEIKNPWYNMVWISGTTYFLNGLDDYAIYTSFYLQGEDVLFSLGVIFGVFLFASIIVLMGKYIHSYYEKNIDKIKLVIASVLVIISVFYIANSVSS